jgi:hypothetical protein
MRRKILIAVLALGTVVGYGAFFARLACHRGGGPGYAGWGGGWRGERQEAFDRHVAELCSDAALRSRPREAASPGVVVIPGMAVPAAIPQPPAPPPPPAP